MDKEKKRENIISESYQLEIDKARSSLLKSIEKYAAKIEEITDHKNKLSYSSQSLYWQKLYSIFRKKLYFYLSLDDYFDKFDMNPLDILNDKEKELIIYRIALYYNKDKKISIINYVNVALRNAANNKLKRNKENFIHIVRFEETKEYESDRDYNFNYETNEDNYSKEKQNHSLNEEDMEIFSYKDEKDTEQTTEQKMLWTMLDVMEREYIKKESGKRLRGNVYTFMLIDYLITITNERRKDFYDKYTFINEEAINHFSIEKENWDNDIKDRIYRERKEKQSKTDFSDAKLFYKYNVDLTQANKEENERYERECEKALKKNPYKVFQKDYIIFTEHTEDIKGIKTHYAPIKNDIREKIIRELSKED